MLSSALNVYGFRAVGLPGDSFGNPPDSYVKAKCGQSRYYNTEVVQGTHNPTWETAVLFFCNVGDSLIVEVMSKGFKNDESLGFCIHKVSASGNDGERGEKGECL
ncbi:uncharacterized protein DAT39_019909, partial [Clarias magur]